MKPLLNGGGVLAFLRLMTIGQCVLWWELARDELSHWRITRIP